MDKQKTNKEQLLAIILDGIKEKKGNNIQVLDFDGIQNAICDFFVICDAESNKQVEAIAYSVESFAKSKLAENVLHIEGLQNAYWVLLDFGNIVVHVFQKKYREFYNLENLWADAKISYIK